VGETITPEGIGGEKAFQLFREVLLKSSISIDHRRHLAIRPCIAHAGSRNVRPRYVCVEHSRRILDGGCGRHFCRKSGNGMDSLPDRNAGGDLWRFYKRRYRGQFVGACHGAEHWREMDETNRAKRGLIIASDGSHSSITSMAKVIDADVLLIENEGRLEASAVAKAIGELSATDRERLFAIIGTGGTTNSGIIDDLAGIAEICQAEGLWFHVDAAYGGGALAAPSVRHLFNGIERADSVTIDPHKWLFSPYDCGAVIYRDMQLAHNAHAQEGSYLDAFKAEGTRGFNPSDYQIQLTRRLRGLPLWFSLAMHGTDRYVQAIERGIELAQIAGRLITEDPNVELVRDPSLSCVLFRRIGWKPEDYTEWTYQNHKAGFALVAPTKWRSATGRETVARFCFINPDTTEQDIKDILATMK
jgi:glutamate/tyrosine decarboxylase-like PLP-dependent enzyme